MFYVGNLAKKEAFHESQGTSSSSFSRHLWSFAGVSGWCKVGSVPSLSHHPTPRGMGEKALHFPLPGSGWL